MDQILTSDQWSVEYSDQLTQQCKIEEVKIDMLLMTERFVNRILKK